MTYLNPLQLLGRSYWNGMSTIPLVNKGPLVSGTLISGKLYSLLRVVDSPLQSTDLEGVRAVLPSQYTTWTNRAYLAEGTNLRDTNCPAGSVNTACQAAFLGIHLTSRSSAYFEVRGVDLLIPTSCIYRMIREPGCGLQTTISIPLLRFKLRSSLGVVSSQNPRDLFG